MKLKNITKQTIMVQGLVFEPSQEIFLADKNYNHNFRKLVVSGKLKILDEIVSKIAEKKYSKVKVTPAEESEKTGDE